MELPLALETDLWVSRNSSRFGCGCTALRNIRPTFGHSLFILFRGDLKLNYDPKYYTYSSFGCQMSNPCRPDTAKEPPLGPDEDVSYGSLVVGGTNWDVSS